MCLNKLQVVAVRKVSSPEEPWGLRYIGFIHYYSQLQLPRTVRDRSNMAALNGQCTNTVQGYHLCALLFGASRGVCLIGY